MEYVPEARGGRADRHRGRDVPRRGGGSGGRDPAHPGGPRRGGGRDRPTGIPILRRSPPPCQGRRRAHPDGKRHRHRPDRGDPVTDSSEISGFYRKSIVERRAVARQWAGLSEDEARAWEFPPGVDPSVFDRMIENVIGVMPLPLGVATNFRINEKDYLIPMAIEEPSVVAAASNAAKVARVAGGFFAQSTDPVMIGQVQIMDVHDPSAARLRILHQREALLAAANAKDPVLVKFGGGAKELEVRILPSPRGTMVIVHLLVDARDAGGMNAVNTMCEALAPELARLAGGRSVLRIISNLAIHRLARAHATFPAELLKTDTATGPQVVDAILDAYALAVADPFRCATHNKGIMNGISSVVIATGNDFRAIESGAHTYA